MKKLFIIGLLVALLLIAMPAMAATTPLYAGQNIEVGYVDISIIGDEMTVRYVLEDGWAVTETHVSVADTLAGIPQTKTFNPIPGQFADSAVYDPPTETPDPFTIDVSDYEAGVTLYIAAHAAVVHVTDGCIDVVSDTTVGVAPSIAPWDSMGLVYPDAYTFPPEANWIWKTDPVVDPVNGEIVEFSKAFNIPGKYFLEKSGDMYVTCDNGYELKLNDDLIGRAQLAENFRLAPALTNEIVWWYDGGDPQTCGGGPYGWQTVEKWEVSDELQIGTNTLQLTGVNEADTTDECPDGVGTLSSNPAGCKFSSGDEGICYSVVDREESAWAAGSPFAGKNWATYYEVGWKEVETVTVPSSGATVSSVNSLTSGSVYRIDASGTYEYWPDQLPAAGIADAECSLRPQGSYNPGPGPQWITGDALTEAYLPVPSAPAGATWLEVNANGVDVNWDEDICNSSHMYSSQITGTGNAVTFKIYDDGYDDNSGSIEVKIYEWA